VDPNWWRLTRRCSHQVPPFRKAHDALANYPFVVIILAYGTFYRFNFLLDVRSSLSLFILLNILDLLINLIVNLNSLIFIDYNAFCLKIVVLLYFNLLIVKNIQRFEKFRITFFVACVKGFVVNDL